MSDGERVEISSNGAIARSEQRAPVVRREGAVALGITAVGALALGAIAIGALAIGKMAIGELGLGRARLRRGHVDDLVIARLRIRELTIERIR
jgi:hypothetical protein